MSSRSEIAFRALGRLSRRDTTPGRSGTGSRYASAAAPGAVWMNRRPEWRLAPATHALKAGARGSLAALRRIMGEAEGGGNEHERIPVSRASNVGYMTRAAPENA